MPRKRQSRPSPIVIVLLAVLIVGAYLAYVAWQKHQVTVQPLEQTPDLVSDDRIIFGGPPRPAPSAGDEVQFTILKNQAYIVGYSELRKDPLWVAYRVHAVVNPPDLPRPSQFATDSRTAAKVRTGDFTRSGYQRGHMAPNQAIADDYGREAQVQTFLLSNICPQTPELNEHVWERLEADERKYANQFEEVWVIDGPIFADINGGRTDHLASGVAVPSAFFKILIDEQDHPGGKPRIFSAIMPQNVKGTELPQQFLSSVSEIEKETHLDFFWKIDPATQAELESKVWKMW
jgi:endonuclease G, mitochondrial